MQLFQLAPSGARHAAVLSLSAQPQGTAAQPQGQHDSVRTAVRAQMPRQCIAAYQVHGVSIWGVSGYDASATSLALGPDDNPCASFTHFCHGPLMLGRESQLQRLLICPPSSAYDVELDAHFCCGIAYDLCGSGALVVSWQCGTYGLTAYISGTCHGFQ